MEPKDLKDILLTVPKTDLAKAMREVMGLSGIRDIEDLWRDFHKVPTAQDHKTGPAMSSSGAGAEAAIHNYSDPAPQIGLVEAYQKFDHTIEDFKGSMHKGFTELGGTISGSIEKLLTAVTNGKAASAKSDEARECWERLGELEQAISDIDGLEGTDPEFLGKASSATEEAERHIDDVEDSEKDEDRNAAAVKAHAAINKGWAALRKARPVEKYGLSGHGNQADEQKKGAKDPGKKEEIKAKALHYARKAGLKVVSKAEEEEEKKEKKEEAKKSPDPDPDPDPKHKAAKSPDPDPDPDPDPKRKSPDPDPDPDPKTCAFTEDEAETHKAAAEHFYGAGLGGHDPADVAAYNAVKSALATYYKRMSAKAKAAGLSLKKSPDPDPDPDPDPKHKAAKSPEPEPDPDPKHKAAKSPDPEPDPDPKMKAMAARLAAVESRLGEKSPAIVPIIFKSKAATDEGFVETMYDRVSTAEEQGELSSDGAQIATALVDRYRAAAKGHVHVSIIDQQLQQAPIEVQLFFENVGREMTTSLS